MGKMFFYAVSVGRKPGVYDTWEQCEDQVKGFQGAKFRKFASQNEAVAFTGLKGKQAETIRAASGKPTIITARSAVRDAQEKSVPVIKQSAVPSPRVASSSRAGPAPVKKFETDTREPLVVYCDGACKGNGGKNTFAGLGVWWGCDDSRNLAERVPAAQTNNRAELLAIVRILEQVPESGRSLIIKSDSQYSIKCVTIWFNKWINNGWRKADGEPVSNKELIHYLKTLLNLREALGQNVDLEYVKGHAGIEGNEMADRQANIGATMEEIPEEPDWEAKRKEVELLIQNLGNEITQMQGPSTTNGVSGPIAKQREELSTVRLCTQESKQATTVATQQQELQTNIQTIPSQKDAAKEPFVAELTEDDFYSADDILSPEDLEAELKELDA